MTPKTERPNVVWIGPRAADAAMLSGSLRPVAIFSADAAERGMTDPVTRSLEMRTGLRRRWGAASVADVVATFASEIQEAARRSVAVVPYAMDRALQELVGEVRSGLVGPTWELQMWLDDKRHALRVFDDARVRRLPYRIMSAKQLSTLALSRRTADRFVVQIPRASGGKGTYFVSAAATELADLASRLDTTDVLVSDYRKESYSLNVHLAVMQRDVLVSPMSVQLIGIPECSLHPAAYCGNDFAAMQDIPGEVIARAQEATTRVGTMLANLGYQGVAGLDLLVIRETNELFPVDLNPRFQASTKALAEAERAAGADPGFVDLVGGVAVGIYGRDEVARYVAPRALPIVQLVFYHRSVTAVHRRRGRDDSDGHTTGTVGGWFLTGLALPGVRVCGGAVLATATGPSGEYASPESAAKALNGTVEAFYEHAA